MLLELSELEQELAVTDSLTEAFNRSSPARFRLGLCGPRVLLCAVSNCVGSCAAQQQQTLCVRLSLFVLFAGRVVCCAWGRSHGVTEKGGSHGDAGSRPWWRTNQSDTRIRFGWCCSTCCATSSRYPVLCPASSYTQLPRTAPLASTL
eukprot:3771844-Rhodomonas_salina.2